MNKILSGILFFIIFFTVFIGMHFYVFFRLFSLFSINKPVLLYLLTFGFPLFFILTRILTQKFLNPFTKFLEYISSLSLGIVFLAFSLLIVFEIINLFVKLNPIISGVIILSILVVLTAYSIINAQQIYVKNINLNSKKLSINYKVVQLTDIHYDSTGRKFNENIVKKVIKVNPDLVLITGDFLDSSLISKNDLQIYNKIKAPIYYITGNHDGYVGKDKVLDLLANHTNMILLKNESINYRDFQIIGIDDSNTGKSVEDVIKKTQLDNVKYSILLFHRPKGFEYAFRNGIDLMLSGHTHSGQIFPFTLFVKLEFKYYYGLYKKGNSYLYISSGTGYWGPAMRLGTRNEIIVFNLRKD